MDNTAKFAFLMEIIDNWITEKKDRYAGPFRCLRQEMWIREICVTPGCSISAAQLKTFLATAVLKIYPWNTNAKVSYRDIQKDLSGEAVKKYSFYYKDLEKCFSPHENRKASERTRLFRLNPQLPETVSGERTLLLFLLERIQEMTREKLGEYWCMCDPDYEPASLHSGERIKWKQRESAKSEKDEDPPPIQKQNKYMECLMLVALHEIFTKECTCMYQELFQEAEKKNWEIKQITEYLTTFTELFSSADAEGQKELLKEGECRKQEVTEYINWIKNYTALLLLCVEHTIGIDAEIQLIMILEMKNLEIMKQNAGLRFQSEKYLHCLEPKNMESFTRYNKNRSKYYRKLESDMDTIFFHYIKCIPETERKNISRAVETYFMTAENRKPDERQLQKLWEAQCILAMPVWNQTDLSKEEKHVT